MIKFRGYCKVLAFPPHSKTSSFDEALVNFLFKATKRGASLVIVITSCKVNGEGKEQVMIEAVSFHLLSIITGTRRVSLYHYPSVMLSYVWVVL